MRLSSIVVTLGFVVASISSPLSQPQLINETEPFFDEIISATPEEISRVFGYTDFDDFIASQAQVRDSANSSSISGLSERSTVSICQRNFALFNDAQTAIYQLIDLSGNARCGNNQLPPGCAIMRKYNSVLLGFCGPRQTTIKCSVAAQYLWGILRTCQYTYRDQLWTGGYQGLNENQYNYVFIDKEPFIPGG